MTLTPLEWDIIDARVTSEHTKASTETKSIAFLRLVLDAHFPDSVDFVEAITDGPNDLGIDAVKIVKSESINEIYLFQSKYRDDYKNISKSINDAEVIKIISFLNQIFMQNNDLIQNSNYKLQQFIQEIWTLHKNGMICRYIVVFCSNDTGLAASARALSTAFEKQYDQVCFEHYSAKDLLKDINNTSRNLEDGALHVVGREIFERADGDVRGAIASIDASSFIDMITNKDGNVKRHIFDDNLRIFLGTAGGYNQSIINTAISNESHLFWYLNNGITITCNNFSYNKGHNNPVLKIEKFQIVNGAQTSHSLVEASKKQPEAIQNVVLTIRVYATNRRDIIEKVAVATNSQARIQARDLRANEKIMQELEIAFAEHGYYFERKRNMHNDKPTEKRIDALKLGQIILSYYIREPDRARGDSDSIFGHRFHHLFHNRLNIEELCCLFEIFKLIEQKRDLYEQKIPKNAIEYDYRLLIYGQWFVVFTVSLICSHNFDGKLRNIQDHDKIIDDAISIITRACKGIRAAHYQVFRSSKTRDRIMAELSGVQGDLLDLLEGNGIFG